MKIIAAGVRLFFTLTGGVFFFWSLFCFLGGPHGKILTKEAFVYGSVFVILGGVFIYAGKKIGQVIAAKAGRN